MKLIRAAAVILAAATVCCGLVGCKKSTPDAMIFLPGIIGSELILEEPTTLDGQEYPAGTKLWIDNENISGMLKLPSFLELLCYSEDDPVCAAAPIVNEISQKLNYGTLDTYRDMYTALYGEFYSESTDVVFYSYDWRQNPYHTARELDSFITEAGYKNAVLVAHSMGGLVSSQYMALGETQRSKINKFISLGTPFLGSVDAVYSFLTGSINSTKISTLFSDRLSEVIPQLPSMYALLPFSDGWSASVYYYSGIKRIYSDTYDEEIALISEAAVGWNDNMYREAAQYNRLMFTDTGHISSLVDSYYIVGDGEDTLHRLGHGILGDMGKETSSTGDGTVPLSSAVCGGMLDESRIYYKYSSDTKNAEHEALGSDKDGAVSPLVADIVRGTHRKYSALELRSLFGITKKENE